MIDILQRVSPSQMDAPSGADPKRLKGFEESKVSSEFKEHLEQKLKKDDPKEKTDSKDLKAENEKPSRGIKKKMVKNDKDDKDETEEKDKDVNTKLTVEPVVSKDMASKENEIETADFDQSLQIAETKTAEPLQVLSEAEANLTPPASAEGELFSVDSEPALSLQLEQPHADSEQSAVSTEEMVSLNGVETEDSKSAQISPSNDFQNKVSDFLQKDQFEFSLQKNIQKDDLQEFKSTLQELSPTAVNTSANEQQAAHSDADSQLDSGDQSSKDSGIEILHAGQNSHSVKSFDSIVKSQVAQAPQNVAPEDSPVKEIMNQAQYLVTKGGGEMMVKLDSSHGLGDVQLKVLMSNGVVNVEMNTNDKSVKKLIEESLSDLKSSLASQQLSLEHVKINNVIATNTENQARFSSDGQGAESQNSQFFEQMKQQMNQQSQKDSSRRQMNFSENRNMNLARPTEIPLTSVKTSAASRYYGLNKGNSLNAVA